MKITEMSMADRPRERMAAFGPEALSNAELLAVLLHAGTVGMGAVDMAQALLNLAEGHLIRLGSLDRQELCKVKGIKGAKALTVQAMFELARRFLSEASHVPDTPVTTAAEVYRIMRPRLKGLAHEECWALMLNRAQLVVGCTRMSSGGACSTTIDIKDIIREALRTGAQGIILVHNHPSGNPLPGQADREQTLALRQAAAAMDLMLLDHVVVCDDSYYSFTDETVARA